MPEVVFNCFEEVKSSQVKSCLRCKYTAIEHISINKA